MRILYVDDDESNFRLVERILEAEGHEVVRACDGEAALRDVRANLPDVVLMDLALPGIDGFETARMMREVPGFDGTPVVAVTAKAMADGRHRAEAEGFAGYVVKPFRVESIRQEVRRLGGRNADGADPPGNRRPPAG